MLSAAFFFQQLVLPQQNMDQPWLSLADVRQLIQIETERLNSSRQPVIVEKPVIEYVTKDPELKPESAGNG